MGKFSRRAISLAFVLLPLLAASHGAGAQPSAPMSGQTLAAAPSVTLAAETTRVALQSSAAAGALKRQLTDLGEQHPVFLVLDDLHAAQEPGIIYEIYLGLPPGAVPAAGDRHFVGTLNFFAVAPPNTARRSRSYNVTALIASLLSQGLSDDSLAVTIVGRAQSQPPAAAHPIIGSVALVAQ
jgi:tyrosinase